MCPTLVFIRVLDHVLDRYCLFNVLLPNWAVRLIPLLLSSLLFEICVYYNL